MPLSERPQETVEVVEVVLDGALVSLARSDADLSHRDVGHAVVAHELFRDVEEVLPGSVATAPHPTNSTDEPGGPSTACVTERTDPPSASGQTGTR